jgi:hypothetical protein
MRMGLPEEYDISYTLNHGINHQANPVTFTLKHQYHIVDPIETGTQIGGW